MRSYFCRKRWIILMHHNGLFVFKCRELVICPLRYRRDLLSVVPNQEQRAYYYTHTDSTNCVQQQMANSTQSEKLLVAGIKAIEIRSTTSREFRTI